MEIIRHVKERESLALVEYLKESRHSTAKEVDKIKTICEMPEITPTICVHVYFLALGEWSSRITFKSIAWILYI